MRTRWSTTLVAVLSTATAATVLVRRRTRHRGSA